MEGADEDRFVADLALEGTGFEPSVPENVSRLTFRLCGICGIAISAEENRRMLARGTDGSNPVPSSGESLQT